VARDAESQQSERDDDRVDLSDVDLRDVGLSDIDLTDLDRFAGGFPHELFTRLRRERPIFWHEPTAHTPDGEGFWVLTRHADVLAAANAPDLFSSDGSAARDTGGGTLIEDLPAGFGAGVLLNMMDDPRHQRIRQLVTPAVSRRALAAMEAELRDRARTIVAAATARGSCDLLVDVAAELPLQAIARLMGIPQEDRHELFRWANVTLDHDDHDLGETSARAQEASAAMFAYGSALIDAKRRCPADDLLSAVANADIATGSGPDQRDEQPLDDLEVQMFFNLLIAAGSETTRNSIAAGVLAFADRPDQWRALQADRSLLPTAVEEILRFASSTTYNRRTAMADTTIGPDDVAVKRG
jgi:cytochrome P450